MTDYQVIRLRTGQLRRVSSGEMELTVLAAARIVEETGGNSEVGDGMLEDKTRLAIALIAMMQDRDYWKARATARLTGVLP